jgi:hypothetical protein
VLNTNNKKNKKNKNNNMTNSREYITVNIPPTVFVQGKKKSDFCQSLFCGIKLLGIFIILCCIGFGMFTFNLCLNGTAKKNDFNWIFTIIAFDNVVYISGFIFEFINNKKATKPMFFAIICVIVLNTCFGLFGANVLAYETFKWILLLMHPVALLGLGIVIFIFIVHPYHAFFVGYN